MAWLWQRDIDDEKRTPGFIFMIKSRLSGKRVSLDRATQQLLGLGIKPGWKVVDFGCGAGHYSVAAAKVVGEGGTVHAVDLHPTAIRMVEEKAAKLGLGNVETIYSDLHTGLDDGAVDAVLLFDVLRGRKDARPLLAELHRVLKRDGRVHVRARGLRGGRVHDLMVKDGLFKLMGKAGDVLNFLKVEGEFHEI